MDSLFISLWKLVTFLLYAIDFMQGNRIIILRVIALANCQSIACFGFYIMSV